MGDDLYIAQGAYDPGWTGHCVFFVKYFRSGMNNCSQGSAADTVDLIADGSGYALFGW